MVVTHFLVTLKEGVNEGEFETWVRDVWSKRLNVEKGPKGMKGQIAKGDRGPAKGHYLGSIFFDSAAVRTWYFPVEGEDISQEGRREIDASGFGEAFDAFWGFADLEWRGDGVVIS